MRASQGLGIKGKCPQAVFVMVSWGQAAKKIHQLIAKRTKGEVSASSFYA